MFVDKKRSVCWIRILLKLTRHEFLVYRDTIVNLGGEAGSQITSEPQSARVLPVSANRCCVLVAHLACLAQPFGNLLDRVQRLVGPL